MNSIGALNLIPAGVIENQDTLGGGGGIRPPPSIWISHVLCPMTNNTSFESSMLYFFIFFEKSSFFCKNVCKKCPKDDKIYISEKPLTMPFQICKKMCKILNNLMCN